MNDEESEYSSPTGMAHGNNAEEDILCYDRNSYFVLEEIYGDKLKSLANDVKGNDRILCYDRHAYLTSLNYKWLQNSSLSEEGKQSYLEFWGNKEWHVVYDVGSGIGLSTADLTHNRYYASKMRFDRFIPGIEKAKEIDYKVTRHFYKLEQCKNALERKLSRSPKFEENVFGIQGSARDGAFIARNFYSSKDSVLIESEIDIFFHLGSIPKTLAKNVENTELPGYVKVSYDKHIHNSIFPKYRDIICRNQCIIRKLDGTDPYLDSAMIFKRIFGTSGKGATPNEVDFMESLVHLVFSGHQKCNVKIVPNKDWMFEDVAKNIKFQIEGDCFINMIECDLVPQIKLEFWPKQANSWLQKGKWPSDEQRKEISKMYHCSIVTKRPTQYHRKYWRFSFSDVEAHILSLLFNQHEDNYCYMIYFLFKCLLYRFLKPVDCRCDVEPKTSFPSYMCKTVFLHVSEEHPPTDEIWKKPYEGLRLLLDRMQQALKSKCLPHYIIPEINILEPVFKNHTCHILGMVGYHYSVLLLDSELHEKLEAIHDFFDVKIDKIYAVFNQIDNFFDAFLKATQKTISDPTSDLHTLLDGRKVFANFKKIYELEGQLITAKFDKTYANFHKQLIKMFLNIYSESIAQELVKLLCILYFKAL